MMRRLFRSGDREPGIAAPSHNGITAIMALSLINVSLQAVPLEHRASRPEYPPAQEIVDRAAARAEQQFKAGIQLLFESEVSSSVASLNGKNEVTKTEETKRLQYPIRGALYEELIEKNGRPLNKKELRNEEKKKEKFIREVNKRTERGERPQPERDPDVHFNPEFVGRYSVKVSGTETLRGHLCWIVDYKPKEGKLPVRKRIDRALNQSMGKFWISQEDYGLVRLEFALRKPFKYVGGLVAVIRNTDGILEFERVEHNTWLPVNFDLKLDMKVMLFKNIRRHFTVKWSDYKRAGRLVEEDR